MIANSQSPTVRCKCLLRRRLHQQARAAELLGMRRRRARLRDHVVDEAVLVPDAGGLVLSAVALALVHVLEDLQEAPVVLLQDRVLGAQVQRPARRGRPRRSPAASAWARPARHPPPPPGPWHQPPHAAPRAAWRGAAARTTAWSVRTRSTTWQSRGWTSPCCTCAAAEPRPSAACAARAGLRMVSRFRQ